MPPELTKEVELIHRKCNIDLEFFALHLQSILISDDKVVCFRIAVPLRFQIEAAPECTLLTVVAGLICNDLLDIADGFSTAVCEVKLIGRRLPVAAHGVLLIEVQGEERP